MATKGTLFTHPLNDSIEKILPKDITKLLSLNIVRRLIVWTILQKSLRFGFLGLILWPFRTVLTELFINNLLGPNNIVTSVIIDALNKVTLPWLDYIVTISNSVKTNIEPI